MPSSFAEDVNQRARATYGVVPNLFTAMAEHTGMPGAVYLAADDALMGGRLTPPEQQAILLELARYHGSRYDAVVHARLGLDAGLAPGVVDALLAGELPEADPMRALIEATRESCEKRGWLDPDTLEALDARGVSRGKLYELFAFVGMKAFTAFTHHLCRVDVDDALKATEEQLETIPDRPQEIKRQRLFLG